MKRQKCLAGKMLLINWQGAELRMLFKRCHNFICRKSIALSLCGGLENGGPSEHVFNDHIIQYSEVGL